METETLDGVGLIRLNRPERGNALSESMPAEIRQAIQDLGSDESVRGIVITGTGRLFCAGGDAETLLSWRDLDEDARVGRFTNSQEVVAAIRVCPVPVVAAINGPAAGAGVDLALACDMRVGADTASFTAAFAAVGLVPDLGGSWLLARLLGVSQALRFLLSGERVDADQARTLGLLDEVAEGPVLVKIARRIIEQVTGSNPRSVVRETLYAVRGAIDHDLATSMQRAARIQAELMTTPEHQARIAAYLPSRARQSNPKKENR